MNRTVVQQPGPKRRAADLRRLKRAVECTASMLTSALWFPFKSQRLSNDLCIPTLAWLWSKTFPSLDAQKYNQQKKKRTNFPTSAVADRTTRAKAWRWMIYEKFAGWETSSKAFSNQSQWAKRFMETGFTWIHLHVSKPNGGAGSTGVIFLCFSSFHSLDFWQKVLKISLYPFDVFFYFTLSLFLTRP